MFCIIGQICSLIIGLGFVGYIIYFVLSVYYVVSDYMERKDSLIHVNGSNLREIRESIAQLKQSQNNFEMRLATVAFEVNKHITGEKHVKNKK